ncbi:MAG: hypothetical protein NW215_02495 [Hyphomicrobiales bacterium]|nr:hypothetical protein [Hyphomicrobiales bacterium]
MPATRSLYVHIGLHKTGSTAIQAALLENAPALARHGILYPVAGRPTLSAVRFGHHELAWAVLNRNSATLDVYRILKNEIEQESGNILISSEEFNKFTENEIQSFCKLMPFEKHIIFYFRKQSDIYQGLYGTDITYNRDLRSVHEYVETTDVEYNFLRLFNNWRNAPGVLSVIARPYDRRRFESGNVVRDFERTLNLPPLQGVDGAPDLNASLPAYAALAVQNLWRRGTEPGVVYHIVDFLARKSAVEKRSYQYLSPQEAFNIDMSYYETNQRFCELTGNDMAFLEPSMPKDEAPETFDSPTVKKTLLEVEQYLHGVAKKT